jgi:hypothetical protein
MWRHGALLALPAPRMPLLAWRRHDGFRLDVTEPALSRLAGDEVFGEFHRSETQGQRQGDPARANIAPTLKNQRQRR